MHSVSKVVAAGQGVAVLGAEDTSPCFQDGADLSFGLVEMASVTQDEGAVVAAGQGFAVVGTEYSGRSFQDGGVLRFRFIEFAEFEQDLS